MSIRDYELAVTAMSERADLQDFIGPRSSKLIQAAEDRLGLRFPQIYRRFLREYGAGSFGSSEIYGIIDGNFEHSSVPNGIWYTLTERKESDLPARMVIIYSDGTGDLFCLDCRSGPDEEEAPVVRFQPGLLTEEQRWELIARDFGSFFLDLVVQEATEAGSAKGA